MSKKEYENLKKTYEHLPFTKYFSDSYSQNGEDGVLHEIFLRLGYLLHRDANWCVEFGAWDGKHLSNTFSLVKEYGWKAVYIEADSRKFKDLEITAKEFSNIIPIKSRVSFLGENSLDNILKKTAIPRNFSLLSIDIDSYDLDIWESLSIYTPKVVVIEINSSVPPGIIWRHSKNTIGNTFSATVKVAHSKDYTLVCHTGNLIFVLNSEIHALEFPERLIKNPELLFMYESLWTKRNPYQINSLSLKFLNRVKRLMGRL